MSSIIGQRSGNRGKCAGTYRLPYELINKEENKIVDKGYLLSSKDVCTLNFIPELFKSGVKSFKIEGRMKTPEYVGVVTSIYRKYIDIALNENKYIVDEEDNKKLMQVFNRGGFSTGYIKGKLGKKMMYTIRPNHMGVGLGKVISYNPNKGYIKLKLEEDIDLGDSIRISENSCKISELMKNNSNIKSAKVNDIVTIGRIKGKIKLGDYVYKTVSLKLENQINQINSKENIKRKVIAKIDAIIGKPVKLEVIDLATKQTSCIIGNIVEKAENVGTLINRIKEQIGKTGGTIFEIESIQANIEENVYITIKEINELRRKALEDLEEKLRNSINRPKKDIRIQKIDIKGKKDKIKVALLINFIKQEYNYKKLVNVDKIYIPISEFIVSKNKEKIEEIINLTNTYIYMPNIIRNEHKNIIYKEIEKIVNKYKIKGFVISNLSQIVELKKYKLEMVANYTLNVFNNETANELEKLKVHTITMSPELNEDEIQNIKTNLFKELIVYGRTPLMTSEYCAIGNYGKCNAMCIKGRYVLKDRMNFEFPIYTNRINCNSTIYNSKITSILWDNLEINSIRIDILEENIDEINKIIETHKLNKRLEGSNYTNGNLKKIV